MEVPAEIYQRYVENRKHDLELGWRSLKGNNSNELEKIGHQLKGNGATFGHPVLSTIGRKLETGAYQRDQATVEAALKDLTRWLHTQLN